MPQIAVRMPEEFLSELKTRGDAATQVRECLERYWLLLRYARADLREILSKQEVSLIVDATNGVMHQAGLMGALWMGIEDAIRLDRMDQKWQVDGAALVEKLKALNPAQTCALIDSCERFWQAVGRGEDITPGDALKEKKK